MTAKRGTDALVAKLVAGASLTEAARAAGISERTARRRLDDPAVCVQLEQVRADLRRQVTDRLRAHSVEAVETLVGIMRDANASDASRTRASTKVVELMLSRADTRLAAGTVGDTSRPVLDSPAVRGRDEMVRRWIEIARAYQDAGLIDMAVSFPDQLALFLGAVEEDGQLD